MPTQWKIGGILFNRRRCVCRSVSLFVQNLTFPCYSKTIQATKLMFSMCVHVIDTHLMRVICQRSRSSFLTLSLNTQMNQAFSKIVLLRWGGGGMVFFTNTSYLIMFSKTPLFGVYITRNCVVNSEKVFRYLRHSFNNWSDILMIM